MKSLNVRSRDPVAQQFSMVFKAMCLHMVKIQTVKKALGENQVSLYTSILSHPVSLPTGNHYQHFLADTPRRILCIFKHVHTHMCFCKQKQDSKLLYLSFFSLNVSGRSFHNSAGRVTAFFLLGHWFPFEVCAQ